ncbi:MAG: hypothetical protein Q9184_004132 [Pyrenodesmia sp. 2 TL-2023]
MPHRLNFDPCQLLVLQHLGIPHISVRVSLRRMISDMKNDDAQIRHKTPGTDVTRLEGQDIAYLTVIVYNHEFKLPGEDDDLAGDRFTLDRKQILAKLIEAT